MSILVLVAVAMALSSGSAYTVAHAAIADEFSISESPLDNLYWPITAWSLGGALFALVATPLMEDFGVYWPFVASWAAMIIFMIPQALAQNFATLVSNKAISGGFVGIIATSAATFLTSLWDDEAIRGLWIGCYVVSYLVGSSIGPVIGAAIHVRLGWRWIIWIQAIYFGIFGLILLLCLVEVKGKPLDTCSQQTESDDQTTIAVSTSPISNVKASSLPRTIGRALLMLATEPRVLGCTLWSAFTLGTIYLFTQSVEIVFGDSYGWNPVQAGFVQGAIVIGEILSLSSIWSTEYLYWKSSRSAGSTTSLQQRRTAEARLYLALPGGLVGVSGGMLIYAWSAKSSISWVAPAAGLALVGWGSVTVINCVASYIVDAYPLVAGSAMVALALGENTFIAFLPLAAQPMYRRLGSPWASTLLAFVSMVLSAIPIVFLMRTKSTKAAKSR